MSELPERTLNAVTKGREGFDYHEDGSFRSASGPDAVGLVRLKMIKSALEFEVKTGMKMSRVSALKAANADLGTNYRTKKQALAHITSLLESAGE